MIEEARTADGKPILMSFGRYLCSRVNPEKEAESWVDSVSKQVSQFPQIVLLGVGSGYQLAALAERFPQKKFVAIDTFPETINFFRRIHKNSITNVEVIAAESIRELEKSSVIRKLVKNIFLVLKHNPSVGAAKETYNDMKIFLTGRSRKGFEFVLSQRPSLKSLFSKRAKLVAVNEWESREPLLSIKDLMENVRDENEFTEMPMYKMRILRELVK